MLFFDMKWLFFGMLSFEEIHKIKALQSKAVFLHMFEYALYEIVYLSVRLCVCVLFVLMCVFECLCVCQCVSTPTSKSHIWLQIKWCMKEGNDRE